MAGYATIKEQYPWDITDTEMALDTDSPARLLLQNVERFTADSLHAAEPKMATW